MRQDKGSGRPRGREARGGGRTDAALGSDPAGIGRGGWTSLLDGALVVNVGEMLEVAMHGYPAATRTGRRPRTRGHPPVDLDVLVAAARRDPASRPADPELAAHAPGVTETPHNAMLPQFGDSALKALLCL